VALPDKRNAALLDIQTTTSAIDQIISEYACMLKAIGQFPKDAVSDIILDSRSPRFYGSDKDPWNYPSISPGGVYEHAVQF
jgi:hypothetical protein